MKAIVQDRYGPADLLSLRDVAVPDVGDDEVLVRVQATSVHVDVWHVVNGFPYALRLMGAGLRRPRTPVPGTDVAGTVERVGSGVTRFAVGDAVMGETLRGIQWKNGGSWAEFVAAPQDGLIHTPTGLTPVEAAAVPTPALLALEVLRDQGGFRAGQSVLVNGAAGAIGVYLVQLAHALGAHRVVGVDRTDTFDLLRSLGADDVVDYTREDVTRLPARYDLLIDVASTLSVADSRRIMTPHGSYVRLGHDHYGVGANRWTGSLGPVLRLTVMSPFVRHLPPLRRSTPRAERLAQLGELLESGRIRPVVGRTFPLAEAVAALRYLESGQATGRIVLTV